MNNLLEQGLESKYIEYVENLPLKDKALQKSFIELLNENDCLKREKIWQSVSVQVENMKEMNQLANPFYLGFGNPDSDLLFIGKEKAFNIINSPGLFIKESVNNTAQWHKLKKTKEPLDHQNLNNEIGFNPMFPKAYHTGVIKQRHTWGMYATIASGLKNKDTKTHLNSMDYNTSFFQDCFMTEFNHMPSKYSPGKMKINKERKDLLSSAFYKRFKTVIIGAQNYVTKELLAELFDIQEDGTIHIVGRNKRGDIKVVKYQNAHGQTFITCNQLSGAAGWTDDSVKNLIHLVRS
ncbi:hypothetical protein [Sediminicola sp. 1XM1-17]|uniref:hypothetical protein n=1 Tax=Sediminicola sp. 1XM1-17 TaxID=3127702 RepID=UPI003078879C